MDSRFFEPNQNEESEVSLPSPHGHHIQALDWPLSELPDGSQELCQCLISNYPVFTLTGFHIHIRGTSVCGKTSHAGCWHWAWGQTSTHRAIPHEDLGELL